MTSSTPSTPRRSASSSCHVEGLSPGPSVVHPSTPRHRLTKVNRLTSLNQSPLAAPTTPGSQSTQQGSLDERMSLAGSLPNLSARQHRYNRINGDTPFRARSAQSMLHSINVPKLAKHRHQSIANETAGHFIGPIMPQVFLETYLPIDTTGIEAFETKFSNAADKEVDWGTKDTQEAKLIEFGSRFVSNMVLSETKNQPDANANGNHPDIGAYPQTIAESMTMNTVKGTSKYLTDFARMSMWVELKRKNEADAFEDPKTFSKNLAQPPTTTNPPLSTNPPVPDFKPPSNLPPSPIPTSDKPPGDFDFDSDTVAGREARGQMATYASASLGLGFRTHLFSVYIRGDNVRFIRWDRAGAIVTAAFDRNTDDGRKRLAEFFWRFDHLTPAAQGFDDTVRDASQTEIDEARPHFDEYYSSRTTSTTPLHFYVLTVPNQDDPTQHGEYIVEQPAWTTRSTFGRSTRGMVAYRLVNLGELDKNSELAKGRLVFLKDYWRAKAEGITKEADVYAHLHAHDVPHIVPLDRGGDIGDSSSFHETHTQQPNGSGSPTEGLETPILETFIHYRLTLDVVATPLLDFIRSVDVLIAICDAMKAHAAAWTCGVLHRDISVGNIMIVYEPGKPPRGILIDWDLCYDFHSQPSTPQPPGPRRPRRTGTWLFMSAELLRNPLATHDFLDDVESAYWLLTWIALLWMQNSLTPQMRHKLLEPYNELYSPGLGQAPAGGTAKHIALTASQTPTDICNVQWTQGTHWNALFTELRDIFAVRYRAKSTEGEREAYEEMKVLASTNPVILGWVQNQPLYQHEQRIRSMKTPGWLSDKLQEYIGKEGWPEENDGPRKQLLAGGNPATIESQILGSRRHRDEGGEHIGAKKKAKSCPE